MRILVKHDQFAVLPLKIVTGLIAVENSLVASESDFSVPGVEVEFLELHTYGGVAVIPRVTGELRFSIWLTKSRSSALVVHLTGPRRAATDIGRDANTRGIGYKLFMLIVNLAVMTLLGAKRFLAVVLTPPSLTRTCVRESAIASICTGLFAYRNRAIKSGPAFGALANIRRDAGAIIVTSLQDIVGAFASFLVHPPPKAMHVEDAAVLCGSVVVIVVIREIELVRV